MKKIKVAVIGCGAITEFRHAPEYKANEHVEIIAFCDPLIKRAEKLAGLYGGKVYSDYMEVLNEDINAVSVCTSNITHAMITLEASKKGMHVLCEKPMATTLIEADNMIRTSQEYGKILMIGFDQRFEAVHIKSKEILDSGEMGKILAFKSSYGHGGPEFWSADKGTHTWFFKKNSAHMGAMGDLGVHKVDLIRWLISDEIDEVSSIMGTLDKKYESGEFIDVEDNAICHFKTRTGIIGSISASWTNYGEEDYDTVLYCEKGVLKIFNDPVYPITIQKKNGDKIFVKIKNTLNNSGVIDSFINSCINGSKPVVTGEDGYESLSVVLACMESSEKKSHVKVNHLLL